MNNSAGKVLTVCLYGAELDLQHLGKKLGVVPTLEKWRPTGECWDSLVSQPRVIGEPQAVRQCQITRVK